jgi:hypothetical protein
LVLQFLQRIISLVARLAIHWRQAGLHYICPIDIVINETACFARPLTEHLLLQGRNVMSLTIRFVLAALALAMISSTASATETITHSYDARGRLIKVVRTGTVNNNNQACYKLDKAGNRINVKKTVNSLPTCP